MFLLLWMVIFVCHAFATRLSKENACSLCECKSDQLNCTNRNFLQFPSFGNDLNASIITLAHNLIKRIRKFPNLPIKSLSFANNNIQNIDDAAFKELISLVALDLSTNLLTSDALQPNIFRGNYVPDAYEPLKNLKELNLANNYLHTLHPYIFEHLPNLKILRLSGNPLKAISHGMIIAISSAPLLKELYLSNTMLKTLPQSVFHDSKYLEVLDLSKNLFTEPPEVLESTHHLQWLSLNGNPIKRIKKFLTLPFLKILHLSKMPELISIEGRSLSNLSSLQEFHCSDNSRLEKIEKTVFSAVYSDKKRETWPPLKVIALNNNSLHSIETHLISRWDNMKIINLKNNPWLCDCENQWLVSVLAPMIEKINPEMVTSFKCAEPAEMNELNIIDLYHRGYEMRCLDYYNHTPEKDGRLLIDICIVTIILTPFLMAVALYYKRKLRSSARYNKSLFYNSEKNDYLSYSQLKLFPDEK